MQITALIRTHPGRDLARTLESCKGITHIIHYGEKTEGYEYNLYCNTLKAQVNDGYFFFLDSDDVVIQGAIDLICPFLSPDKATIVQMLRNGRPKPRTSEIVRGKIGMPCMILHHSMKDIADLDDTVCADYNWIKAVTGKIPYNFIPIPLVDAGKRNHGA